MLLLQCQAGWGSGRDPAGAGRPGGQSDAYFGRGGGASFVLAFALQSNLSNVASGFMMMWHKPFDVNDHVQVAGVNGFVKAVNLTNTVIRASSNDVYVMPNEMVWNSVLMNSTTEGKIRREVLIQVGFGEDIKKVEALLIETAAVHPRVLEEPQPSTLVRFAESYVVVRLRPWMEPRDYDRVPSDLHRMIAERFQQAGIAIAIPSQSIHYDGDEMPETPPVPIKAMPFDPQPPTSASPAFVMPKR